MPNSESKPPSVDYILSRTSDEKTLALFDSIANSDGDRSRSAILRKSNFTEKQYYARISGLMDAGLIKRRKGEYSLTLLGKVVYESQMIIGKALTYYGRLKAIEEIEMSYGTTFPKEELAQLINALIDSDQIKDAIMKPISVGSNREDVKMQLVKKPNRR
jgi:predicted transcriptional regulator